MNALELLKEIKYEVLQGDIETVEVKGIKYDSRKVQLGDLFVCRRGEHTDGHKYAEQVVENGAKMLLVEDALKANDDVCVVKVDNCDAALSKIAAKYYNHPSSQVDVIGITGTNGKTSISYLITEMLNKAGRSVGVIGTIGMVLNGEKVDIETTMPTTPDALELQQVLANMNEMGAQHVVMEVSSIALEQNRVSDCEISMGVFTNLTVDHLDFHKTMENYKDAKYKLFEKTEVSVINIDDKAGAEYVKRLSANKDAKKILTYSAKDQKADYYISDIIVNPGETEFNLTVDGQLLSLKTQLTGSFNVYNLVAAIAVAREKGVNFETIQKALEEMKGARGRFETIKSEQGVSVIVDYAHSPDALEKVLQTINEFKKTGTRKITTVFGCGGDRDKTKRPQMAEVAARLSEETIITSDNPRTENPLQILKEIEVGIKTTDKCYQIIEDREQAIKVAIENSGPNDIVLIAGKGHETYQILKDKTVHFDDLEVAKKYLGLKNI